MATGGNNIRRTITNLRDPQQIRELNRQLEWIWNQLLGGLNERAFSTTGSKRFTEVIQNTISQNIDADNANVARLKASIANIMVATLAVANIDYAKIVDLNALNAAIRSLDAQHATITTLNAALAEITKLGAQAADIDYAQIKDVGINTAIITDGEADTLYIKRLTVTTANMVNAVIGELVLKSTDGHYYVVHVGSDGTIFTQRVSDPTAGELEAAETADGRQIIETTANISDLSGENLRYNRGIFEEIVTHGLTVTGQLDAVSAFLASAEIPELRVEVLKALGNVLDISANDSILLSAGDDSRGLRRILRLDQNGVHVGDSRSSKELLLTEEGACVLVDDVKYSRFAANYVQFGKYQQRRTLDGGMAFVMVPDDEEEVVPLDPENVPEVIDGTNGGE